MLPLSGIRVVEITENIAGPFAGLMLASLGADVIKVERPGRGDDTRFWGPPVADGAGYTFHAFNHNKRGVTVDLQQPAEVARLRDYIRTCDVVLQNLRPGTVAKLKLDPETLRADQPELVYCSLWAYGADGPMKLRPGYDFVVQAFSGMYGVNGDAGAPPQRLGVPALDLGTGMWAAFGCLAALMERQRTGVGCVVDSSLFESSLNLLCLAVGRYMATGYVQPRHRTGAPQLGVFQAYATADGEIQVAAPSDRLFARFADAIGRPGWKTDPRYASTADRAANRPELEADIEAVLKTRPTADWRRLLDASDVPCAPINSIADAIGEPQTDAIGILRETPGTGVPVVGLPFAIDGERPPVRRPAPRLGQHNDEVFGGEAPGGPQE